MNYDYRSCIIGTFSAYDKIVSIGNYGFRVEPMIEVDARKQLIFLD